MSTVSLLPAPQPAPQRQNLLDSWRTFRALPARSQIKEAIPIILAVGGLITCFIGMGISGADPSFGSRFFTGLEIAAAGTVVALSPLYTPLIPALQLAEAYFAERERRARENNPA